MADSQKSAFLDKLSRFHSPALLDTPRLVAVRVPGIKPAYNQAIVDGLEAAGILNREKGIWDTQWAMEDIHKWARLAGYPKQFNLTQSNELLDPPYNGITFLTIVGDPVWRLQDAYRNAAKKKGASGHETISKLGLGPAEFFAHPSAEEYRNRQVKFLSKDAGEAGCLDRARELLGRHCAWIGLEGHLQNQQDSLNETLRDQFDLSDCPPITFPEQKAPTAPDLTEADIKSLRESNALDFALWDTLMQQANLDHHPLNL